jgi:uncharacterized protein YggE
MHTSWWMPAVAGVMFLGVLDAQAQEASSMQPPPDVIVTSGEGIVQATPDRAFVSIASEARAKLPKDAQQANAQAMSAVQAKLKAIGIGGDAIKTTAVDLQPEFDYQNGKQTLKGYVARNTTDVRVEPVERVGEIIDAAVGSGATSISGVRFDLKDRAGVEKKALHDAVADARGRAEALAQAAGRTIDRIIRIDDQGVRSAPPPRQYMMAMKSATDAISPTPVEAGQLEIRANVSLTVRLK